MDKNTVISVVVSLVASLGTGWWFFRLSSGELKQHVDDLKTGIHEIKDVNRSLSSTRDQLKAEAEEIKRQNRILFGYLRRAGVIDPHIDDAGRILEPVSAHVTTTNRIGFPTQQILVEPNDVTDEVIKAVSVLIKDIQALSIDYDVHLAYYEPRGTQQSFWEKVFIWTPWGTDKETEIGQVKNVALAWMRIRFTDSPDKWKMVVIYSARDEVVATIRLKSAGDDPEYPDPKESAFRLRPPV